METQHKSTVATAASIGEFRPIGGFVLSLVAGVLILAGGLTMLGYYSGPYGGMMGVYGGMMGSYSGGMMNGYYAMMQGIGGWFYGFAVIGVAAGVLVLFWCYHDVRQAKTGEYVGSTSSCFLCD